MGVIFFIVPYIMMNMLEVVRKADWEEVFAAWRKDERAEGQWGEGWEKMATQAKGWGSWEEWRRYQFSLLLPEKREWKLYKVLEPMAMLPKFLVGPTQSWQEQLPAEMRLKTSFADFVRVREDWARQHERFADIGARFPEGTQMIGVYLEDVDAVMCLEGHHRCAGVALAARDGKVVNFGEQPPLIAIASLQERGVLEQMLKQGTVKPGA